MDWYTLYLSITVFNNKPIMHNIKDGDVYDSYYVPNYLGGCANYEPD